VTAGETVDFVVEIIPDPDWAAENIFEFGDARGAGAIILLGIQYQRLQFKGRERQFETVFGAFDRLRPLPVDVRQ
jgi:hypothetical protein